MNESDERHIAKLAAREIMDGIRKEYADQFMCMRNLVMGIPSNEPEELKAKMTSLLEAKKEKIRQKMKDKEKGKLINEKT